MNLESELPPPGRQEQPTLQDEEPANVHLLLVWLSQDQNVQDAFQQQMADGSNT